MVVGHQKHPAQPHWLRMYKLGEGPIYTFYAISPVSPGGAFTVARAALFGDAMVVPDADHVVDVVTCAKRDLKAGESLDGISFYMTYGVCEERRHHPA